MPRPSAMTGESHNAHALRSDNRSRLAAALRQKPFEIELVFQVAWPAPYSSRRNTGIIACGSTPNARCGTCAWRSGLHTVTPSVAGTRSGRADISLVMRDIRMQNYRSIASVINRVCEGIHARISLCPKIRYLRNADPRNCARGAGFAMRQRTSPLAPLTRSMGDCRTPLSRASLFRTAARRIAASSSDPSASSD